MGAGINRKAKKRGLGDDMGTSRTPPARRHTNQNGAVNGSSAEQAPSSGSDSEAHASLHEYKYSRGFSCSELRRIADLIVSRICHLRAERQSLLAITLLNRCGSILQTTMQYTRQRSGMTGERGSEFRNTLRRDHLWSVASQYIWSGELGEFLSSICASTRHSCSRADAATDTSAVRPQPVMLRTIRS
jgi:hypothetical protein